MQVVQTKDDYYYREWNIGGDVDFFVDECNSMVRYTQKVEF